MRVCSLVTLNSRLREDLGLENADLQFVACPCCIDAQVLLV